VPNKLVWGGPIPMPANNVTADEAKTLATWVLTVK
jgi:cytochrome c551/c552